MAYYPYDQPKRKIHFSKKEIQDLLIAMGVVTIAFALALSSEPGLGIFLIYWDQFPLSLLISLLAVGTGFIFHELGHKFVANRYGAWAEFRAWVQGLTMALMLALILGVVFAAPGAVYIAGNISEEQNGKISVAGPMVNLAVAAFCFPFIYFTTGVLLQIVFFVYYINAFLAVFNLIPIMPLDGAKVAKWNIGVYIALLAMAIGLLIPAFL